MHTIKAATHIGELVGNFPTSLQLVRNSFGLVTWVGN